MRSAMCVPLMHGGEVLGAIHCDTLLKTNVFREEDLELFTSIASQAAVAVKNAMLLQRLQEEASARVQFQRFFSPGLVDRIISGPAQGEPARRGAPDHGPLPRRARLHPDVRGDGADGRRRAPQRLLRADGGRALPPRRHARQVRRRRDHGALRGAGDARPTRPAPRSRARSRCARSSGGSTTEQKATGPPTLAVGIGIHTGPRALRDVRLQPHAPVHGDGRHGEHGRAPLLGRQGGPDPGQRRRPTRRVKDFVEVEALVPIEVKGKSRGARRSST